MRSARSPSPSGAPPGRVQGWGRFEDGHIGCGWGGEWVGRGAVLRTRQASQSRCCLSKGPECRSWAKVSLVKHQCALPNCGLTSLVPCAHRPHLGPGLHTLRGGPVVSTFQLRKQVPRGWETCLTCPHPHPKAEPAPNALPSPIALWSQCGGQGPHGTRLSEGAPAA